MKFQIKIKIKENFSKRFTLNTDPHAAYIFLIKDNCINIPENIFCEKTKSFIATYFNDLKKGIETLNTIRKKNSNDIFFKIKEYIKLNEIILKPNDYEFILFAEIIQLSEMDITKQFNEAYFLELLTNDLVIIYMLFNQRLKEIKKSNNFYNDFVVRIMLQSRIPTIPLNNFNGLKNKLFKNISNESLKYFPYNIPNKGETIAIEINAL